MRAVIQRVIQASVTIDGKLYSEIGRGLLIFLGISKEDREDDMKLLAEKCVGLRIFKDEHGKMNLDAESVGGEILVVPNFTLYGDCAKGKRPNFMEAESPDRADLLFRRFIERCRLLGTEPKTGSFGANMKVSVINDGPVNIFMDTKQMRTK